MKLVHYQEIWYTSQDMEMLQQEMASFERQGEKRIVFFVRALVLLSVLAFLAAVASLNMMWVALYEHTPFTDKTVSATGFDFIQHGIGVKVLLFSVSGVSLEPVWTVLLMAVMGSVSALVYWPPRAMIRWRIFRYAVIIPLLCGIAGMNACRQTLQDIAQFGIKEFLYVVNVTMKAGPGVQWGMVAFVVATLALTMAVVVGEIFLYREKRQANTGVPKVSLTYPEGERGKQTRVLDDDE